MAQNSTESNSFAANQTRNSGLPVEPQELIFRYLKYLPWVVVCVVIAALLSYIRVRYTTPIYHVQSMLLIHQEEMSGGGDAKDSRFQNIFMTQGGNNIKNELQILKSSSVMHRVVQALHLELQYFSVGKIRTSQIYPETPFKVNFLDSADTLTPLSLKITFANDNQFNIDKDKTLMNFGQEFRYQGHRLMLSANPDISYKTFGTPEFLAVRGSMEEVTASILSGLSIAEPPDESTILTLSFNGENPKLGQDVLNTIMKVYDSLIIEDKNRISTNTLSFIDKQLDILHGQLGDVESKTKGFMVTNQVFDIVSQSKTYSDNLEDIAKKDEDMHVRIAVLDMLANYLGSSKTNGSVPVPSNLGIDEPALVQSVTEYNRMELQREVSLKTTTPDNPLILQMNTSLEKLRNDILQVLKNVRQSYEIASKSLQSSEGANQDRLKSMPGKSMQLLNIQRQQKILEDLYSFLLMKRLETSMSAAATISNSKVVEPAAGSSVPVSPDTKSIYLFNILIGILIPSGIIVVREMLKNKVLDRADIESRTQAPILGEISHSDSTRSLVVHENSRRFISEQFRTIRSNLKYITAKYDKPIILVTSSFSGEGKSFVSTNIGAVMALTGKKTVIMEFDIRKPKIVEGLELKRKHGISNYVIGNVKFQDLLLPVNEVDGLYVIPCGPIPPNPAELLLDEKLAQLMEQAIAHFDVVILDTAPVGLVGDAYSLAKFANCTLFIVRQDYTFRNQIFGIEEIYQEKKLPGISVVLNDVKVERGYLSGGYYKGRYGYYSGYGYATGNGYFDEDKRQGKSGWEKLIAGIRRLFP